MTRSKRKMMGLWELVDHYPLLRLFVRESVSIAISFPGGIS